MKNSVALAICWSLFLILSLSSKVLGQSGASDYDPNLMLIGFSASASNAQINNLKQLYGAVENEVSPVSEIRLWSIPHFPTPGPLFLSDINEVIQHANAQPEVTGSGLNYLTVNAPPPVLGSLAPWTSNGLCRFSLKCANGNTPVKVAVLDTGVSFGCEDFSGYFDPNYLGIDFVNNDETPNDDNGHGTHIASIIAKIARLGENTSLKLFAFKTHDANGVGDVFNIIKAIDHAIMKEVNIINMSFSYNAYNGNQTQIAGAYEPNLIGGGPLPNISPTGTPKKAPLHIAIDKAGANGTLVVAAAGNQGQNNDATTYPCYPASFASPNLLTVASVDCQQNLSGFSNWGSQMVDIGAPGESIEAKDWRCRPTIKSGTSQAAAVVSGVALQLGTHFTNTPFHFTRVKCAILNSADYYAPLSTRLLAKGTINAANALEAFWTNYGCTTPGRFQAPSTATPAPMALETSPNPFNSALRIRFEVGTASDVHLAIFDAQGKTVFARAYPADSGQQEIFWEPANASTGLYSIRLQTSEGTQTSKALLLR